MTDKKDLNADVSEKARRIVIDVAQAASYYCNSEYERFEKNLFDILKSTNELIDLAQSEID